METSGNPSDLQQQSQGQASLTKCTLGLSWVWVGLTWVQRAQRHFPGTLQGHGSHPLAVRSAIRAHALPLRHADGGRVDFCQLAPRRGVRSLMGLVVHARAGERSSEQASELCRGARDQVAGRLSARTFPAVCKLACSRGTGPRGQSPHLQLPLHAFRPPDVPVRGRAKGRGNEHLRVGPSDSTADTSFSMCADTDVNCDTPVATHAPPLAGVRATNAAIPRACTRAHPRMCIAANN